MIKHPNKMKKSAFDGLIIRLDITEERISELEHKPIKNSQTEMKKNKKNKNRFKNYGTILIDVTQS